MSIIPEQDQSLFITVASDENYIQHLWVMLISMLEHTSESQNIKLYIIDGGITEESKSKLLNYFSKKYGLYIIFSQINKDLYKNCKISHHVSQATYYRFSIPSIIPDHVKKVLYLDCDVVIKDDISKLWSFDLNDSLIGAIYNPFFNRFIELNIDQNKGYFNAGVLLINLFLWRKLDISHKALNFIDQNPEKIKMWDQDALNAVIKGCWLKLSPRWNQQSAFFDFYFQKFYREKFYSKEEFQEALYNPAIIHYSSMCKPWDYDNVHPYRNEYYRYLSQTPWSDFRPQPTPQRIIKKIVKQYTPKVIFETMKILQRRLKKAIGKEV